MSLAATLSTLKVALEGVLYSLKRSDLLDEAGLFGADMKPARRLRLVQMLESEATDSSRRLLEILAQQAPLPTAPRGNRHERRARASRARSC